MRILITGIHGFVGSNLVKALSPRGHDIYGLDIVAPDREGVIRTFSWDDLNEGLVPQVDAIIHLAGKAHDVKNRSEAQTYFDINTGLTMRIYDHFRASDASTFIFFSSVKAAADCVPTGTYLAEDVEPAPVGPYGESKIAAEEYIAANPSDKTKTVVVLRPCMIHGPGNKGNLNLLYGVVRRGIPWPLGAYDNLRTFTSVDNLTFVISRMLERGISSGTYHMADDEAVSTNDLIRLICEGTGRKPHIWRIPKWLINPCAKVGTWLHLPLNSERLRKLTEDYCVSNAKLKQALSIDKMPVRAKDGITTTIKSFASK